MEEQPIWSAESSLAGGSLRNQKRKKKRKKKRKMLKKK
jgi:hypothetical protein